MNTRVLKRPSLGQIHVETNTIGRLLMLVQKVFDWKFKYKCQNAAHRVIICVPVSSEISQFFKTLLPCYPYVFIKVLVACLLQFKTPASSSLSGTSKSPICKNLALHLDISYFSAIFTLFMNIVVHYRGSIYINLETQGVARCI